jgi:hypothetical protein
MSLYLGAIYGHPEHGPWFRKAWAATGKKLDMGKSCVRFRKLEDLALDVVGEAIRRAPAGEYIRWYEMVTDGRRPAAAIGKGKVKLKTASAKSRSARAKRKK